MLNGFEYLALQIHGGSHSGGVAGFIEEFLAMVESLIANGPEGLSFALLPGLAEMPNIHPLLVHFPIALLSVFLCIDLSGSLLNKVDWRRTASWFLYLGTISILLTIWAGFNAAATVPHNEYVHHILEQHKTYGLTVATITVTLSFWRMLAAGSVTGFANFIYQLISIIAIMTMVVGADLGGLMVYQHGVGKAGNVQYQEGIEQYLQDQIHHHGHNHDHSH